MKKDTKLINLLDNLNVYGKLSDEPIEEINFLNHAPVEVFRQADKNTVPVDLKSEDLLSLTDGDNTCLSLDLANGDISIVYNFCAPMALFGFGITAKNNLPNCSVYAANSKEEVFEKSELVFECASKNENSVSEELNDNPIKTQFVRFTFSGENTLCLTGLEAVGFNIQAFKYENIVLGKGKSASVFLENKSDFNTVSVNPNVNTYYNEESENGNTFVFDNAYDGNDNTVTNLFAGKNNKESVNILMDIGENKIIDCVSLEAGGGIKYFPSKVRFYFDDNKAEISGKSATPIYAFDKKSENGIYTYHFVPQKASFVRIEILESENSDYGDKIISIIKNIKCLGFDYSNLAEKAIQRRSITANLSDVVCNDYDGVGDNYWSGPDTFGMNDGYETVNYKRINTVKPAFVRMMFMPGWLVDFSDSPAEQERKWKAGIYYWQDEAMKEFLDNCRALDAAGSTVQINMGGRVHHQIKEWFSIKGVTLSENGTRSAPRDLDAFAQATVAVVKYLREKGCKNIEYISFYNETQGGNYEAFADKRLYWSEMIKKVHYKLIDEGIRDTIKIYGTDLSGTVECKEITSYLDFVIENCRDENGKPCYDFLSTHEYPQRDDYPTMLDVTTKLVEKYPAIRITEFSTGQRPNATGANSDNYCGYSHDEADQVIAHANSGCGGSASWFLCGTTVPEPINVVQNTMDICMWLTPSTKINDVSPKFAEMGLLMRYIPRHCKVVKTFCGSDDLISATFVKDDDITIVVDSDDSETEKLLTVYLDNNSNGKVFERHSYVYPYDRSKPYCGENALLPVTDYCVTVSGGKVTDKLPKGHALVVYTTLKQEVQIVLEHVSNTAKPNEKVQLNITEIYGIDKSKDDVSNNDAVWEVIYGGGTVDQNGLYTASNVKKGDTVSVKVTSKFNPDSYAVAIVDIR